MLSTTGTSGCSGGRTLIVPLWSDTSSVSTTMPGLVISVTEPLWTRISIRLGTTQRPSRLALPLCDSMRMRSLGLAGAASPGAAGRSLVSATSSPYVRAVSATSSRWSSSSAVSRPSPAAIRSSSTIRSRSSCDARNSRAGSCSSPLSRGVSSPAMGHTVRPGQVLPGPAAAHARRTLGDDVRAFPRVLVPDLDEDPAALAGAGQREATGELAAVRRERQMSRLVPGDVGGALIPDDHGAAAAPGIGVHALELTRFQRVVLDRHGEPPDRGVERGSLGHRP